MKLYCQVKEQTREDGTNYVEIIEGPCELPQNSATISNLNALDDNTLQMFGWLPLEQQTDDKPIFVSSSYEILKNKVIEKIITRDKTEAEIFAEKQKQNYYKWQEIREQRNKLLDQSDKLVMIDRWEYLADEEKTKITTYRKLLRDLPSQYTDPFSVVFPIL